MTHETTPTAERERFERHERALARQDAEWPPPRETRVWPFERGSDVAIGFYAWVSESVKDVVFVDGEVFYLGGDDRVMADLKKHANGFSRGWMLGAMNERKGA